MTQVDPLIILFAGSIGLVAVIMIYLIVKRLDFRKAKVEEAKQAVEEELGETLPEDLIKKIIEKKTEETAERELRKLEQKQKIKQVKKANRGLLKLKKKLIVVFMRKGGLPPEIVELGRTHSYDRFSLDGKEDRMVIYYYPKHSSVFLNGLQRFLAIFGRGRKRLQVPIGAVLTGEKVTIIYADHMKSIAPHTYEIIPPEEIRVEMDLFNAYRDRYETLKSILEQTLDDLRLPFKKAMVFRGGGYYVGEPYRHGIEDRPFFPGEASEETAMELIDDVWARLKQRKRSLGGENG